MPPKYEFSDFCLMNKKRCLSKGFKDQISKSSSPVMDQKVWSRSKHLAMGIVYIGQCQKSFVEMKTDM